LGSTTITVEESVEEVRKKAKRKQKKNAHGGEKGDHLNVMTAQREPKEARRTTISGKGML